MSAMIRCEFFQMPDGESSRQTMEFLSSLGLTYDSSDKLMGIADDQVFLIEVHDLPQIIQDPTFDDQDVNLDLFRITEHGVSLYATSPLKGDGYIFIPMSNIVAIHDGWWSRQNS